VRTENGIEYGDLPKFVNFDYVANVARVNAATLAALASAPAPPRNVRLETRVSKATVPVSKDNVIFAVQSVDEAGHRSLPVVPVPER
jgi:hypothetical protein